MTHGQIHCFIAVVNEGSFAKAANALFISQPAISKSISKLEDELGFPLLERKVGSLRPTPAGSLLYDYFKRYQDEFKSLINDINNSLLESSGTVKIGCPETWDPAKFYTRISSYFEEHHPSVSVNIECHNPAELLPLMQAGKIDIIMTHEFYSMLQHGLTVRKLTDSNCGILYSNAYFGKELSLPELKDIDFLVFDSDTEKKFGIILKRVFGKYGFAPTIKNCNQISSAMFNMACGKGVMFFTDWDHYVASPNYTFLPINYKTPINIIYPTVTSNPKTHLIADELIKLYSDDQDAE